jgi:hypothetical protein
MLKTYSLLHNSQINYKAPTANLWIINYVLTT